MPQVSLPAEVIASTGALRDQRGAEWERLSAYFEGSRDSTLPSVMWTRDSFIAKRLGARAGNGDSADARDAEGQEAF
jgi:hypothetical protein